MSDKKEPIQNFIDKDRTIEMGGGEKAIEKQHNSGKLTARERIDLLLDENTFFEIDKFVEHRCTNFEMGGKKIPADGIVTGIGEIEGRKVAVFSQDFTVLGGSLGEMHAKKIMKIQDLSMKMGIPVIGINDSGGARIQEAVDALYGYGGIFFRNTRASGVIPQISIIMGPCAGGAVYSPAITDFIIMVDQNAKMFITGPQVIQAVTGEKVSQEDLGGAGVHNTKSGNAHFKAKDDEDALKICRKLLSYIPSNNIDPTPFFENYDTVDNSINVETIIPQDMRKGYDVREIIDSVVDKDSFFEVQELYSPNIVIGFASVNGKSVGIVANQPKVWAGSLDINSSDKAARFIRFLDSFSIPIITFVDTPGFLPGTNQEYNGIIRHGAKLLYAYSEATSPKITFILRKAYGGAYIAMGSQHLGADFVFALPTAQIAVMGPEGAANVIFRKEIESSENPEETRTQKIDEYKDNFANPYQAAARGYVDRILLPSDMRKVLIESIAIAETKAESYPDKKHGNIPL